MSLPVPTNTIDKVMPKLSDSVEKFLIECRDINDEHLQGVKDSVTSNQSANLSDHFCDINESLKAETLQNCEAANVHINKCDNSNLKMNDRLNYSDIKVRNDHVESTAKLDIDNTVFANENSVPSIYVEKNFRFGLSLLDEERIKTEQIKPVGHLRAKLEDFDRKLKSWCYVKLVDCRALLKLSGSITSSTESFLKSSEHKRKILCEDAVSRWSKMKKCEYNNSEKEEVVKIVDCSLELDVSGNPLSYNLALSSQVSPNMKDIEKSNLCKNYGNNVSSDTEKVFHKNHSNIFSAMSSHLNSVMQKEVSDSKLEADTISAACPRSTLNFSSCHKSDISLSSIQPYVKLVRLPNSFILSLARVNQHNGMNHLVLDAGNQNHHAGSDECFPSNLLKKNHENSRTRKVLPNAVMGELQVKNIETTINKHKYFATSQAEHEMLKCKMKIKSSLKKDKIKRNGFEAKETLKFNHKLKSSFCNAKAKRKCETLLKMTSKMKPKSDQMYSSMKRISKSNQGLTDEDRARSVLARVERDESCLGFQKRFFWRTKCQMEYEGWTRRLNNKTSYVSDDFCSKNIERAQRLQTNGENSHRFASSRIPAYKKTLASEQSFLKNSDSSTLDESYLKSVIRVNQSHIKNRTNDSKNLLKTNNDGSSLSAKQTLPMVSEIKDILKVSSTITTASRAFDMVNIVNSPESCRALKDLFKQKEPLLPLPISPTSLNFQCSVSQDNSSVFQSPQHFRTPLHFGNKELSPSMSSVSSVSSCHHNTKPALLTDSSCFNNCPINSFEKNYLTENEMVLQDTEFLKKLKEEMKIIEMLVTIQKELLLERQNKNLCEIIQDDSPPKLTVSIMEDSSNNSQQLDAKEFKNVVHQMNTLPSINRDNRQQKDKSRSLSPLVFSSSPKDSLKMNLHDSEICHPGNTDMSQEKTDKALEEKIITLSRNALKSYYHKGTISSLEFKVIMKKAITKISESKSKEITQPKVARFIDNLVANMVGQRKKLKV